MNIATVIQLIILILMVLLSGFFSSAETAMTTISKIKVQTLVEEEIPKAKILSKVIEDPGKMLSTILIGNNIVNMTASALMTTLVIKLFGNIYVGVGTGVLTLMVLLFGEITPKTLATIHAEKIALSYAVPIYCLMVILTPVISIVSILAKGIILIIGVDPNAHPPVMTEHELRTLLDVSQQEGVIEEEEQQMIKNVFDFGDSKAKDVMIPRIDMTFVDVNSTYNELLDIFKEDKHTRFPVFEENTDNVIGIINMKDLILYEQEKKENEFSIRDLLRKPYFTYEYKETADLLVDMRKAQVSFAIVIDEYGSVAGLVTLEDLLEEIVGEIRDEYDTEEEEDIRELQSGREYIALGSAKLNDINEAFDISLESEDNDSLGGYIIEQLDCFPTPGQAVILGNGIRLVVDELDKNRIELVHIWLPEKETEEK
ncbi:MAG: hemolysin family protein [Eubacteriales bacterium]|nr:hemolysin family protein [Eubacteriales bacterium]